MKLAPIFSKMPGGVKPLLCTAFVVFFPSLLLTKRRLRGSIRVQICDLNQNG